MSAAIALPVVVPVLLAVLGGWSRLRPALLPSLPWAAAAGLMVAVLPPGSELEWRFLTAHAVWGIDELRRTVLVFTALLWMVAGAFAASYLRDDPRAARFAAFWLLTLAGNLMLILANDVLSFYTGFAWMTFAAYGLVVHQQSRETMYAARVYLAMALIGELLLLTGLLLAFADADSLLLADLPAAIAASERGLLVTAVLFTGFGIKAGAPLLHVWLPLAHPAAPTPASAVLSGAMIKAGVLGWVFTLPLGEAALPLMGALVIAIGFLGALGAAALGVLQSAPKIVLAYSSVSQMGLMTMMVGASLLQPASWPVLRTALIVFAAHHALAKGALFLAVGVEFRTAGLTSRLAWILAWLPGLALAGLPLTSGAAAKLGMKSALSDAADGWTSLATGMLLLSSFATAMLVARFYQTLCAHGAQHDRRDGGSTRAWIASVAASVLLFWWLPLPAGASAESGASPDHWPELLLPALLGLGAAALLRSLIEPGTDRLQRLRETLRASGTGLLAAALHHLSMLTLRLENRLQREAPLLLAALVLLLLAGLQAGR